MKKIFGLLFAIVFVFTQFGLPVNAKNDLTVYITLYVFEISIFAFQ